MLLSYLVLMLIFYLKSAKLKFYKCYSILFQNGLGEIDEIYESKQRICNEKQANNKKIIRKQNLLQESRFFEECFQTVKLKYCNTIILK